ncbi:MAG: clostripain-related cysteine peptidase, partial [Pseudothermotoga sp.]
VKYYNVRNNDLLVDLKGFAYYTQNVGDTDVQDYAQQIQNVLAELIVYEYVEKTNDEIQNPVSIFMPNKKDVMLGYYADYKTLSFFELHWFNFLESWLE